MNDIAIRAENLSKSYRLSHRASASAGVYRYRRLSDALLGAAKAPLRRFRGGDGTVKSDGRATTEAFWALRSVSFEIKKGDVVGIVGRNGAGKSTLLKILSRITSPTSGRVELDGRVASLLEVGTGFHPELTGRENIFLNGSVLGMTRVEIKRKFDEIVDFAEVARFLDTPVKRYSSGMYVRLAFAVAAHLEPEILIVDEVLAVGDAEFQKKCLGKMQDVATHDGRTVLFVSHNMQAISHLCKSAILLKAGSIAATGGTGPVIDAYLAWGGASSARKEWDFSSAPSAPDVRVKAVSCRNSQGVCSEFNLSEPVLLEAEFWVTQPAQITVSFHIFDKHNVNLFASANLVDPIWGKHTYTPGLYRSRCIIPKNLLADGQHSVKLYISGGGNSSIVKIELPEVVSFAMKDDGVARGGFLGTWLGAVRPLLEWQGERIDSN